MNVINLKLDDQETEKDKSSGIKPNKVIIVEIDPETDNHDSLNTKLDEKMNESIKVKNMTR